MDDLIDQHVSVAQVEKAVKALTAYIEKSRQRDDETELLGAKEDFVWLVLATKRMHPEKKLKPFKIPLSHPLVDPRTSSVCLITKDPQRQYKDLLAAKNIKFISRVVGIEKLKGKFKPFETRRQLLQEHQLFLADERVIPLLPNLLGKMFFDAKRQPIPVCITKKDIKSELEAAISATYMHQNKGTCTSIKIAPSTLDTKRMVQNLVTALPAIVAYTPEGWENVQSLHIKTSQSVSLPIWTCDLGVGEGARWAKKKAGSAERETEDNVEAEQPVPSSSKGAKRRNGNLDSASEAPASKKQKSSPVGQPSSTKPPSPKSNIKPSPLITSKKVVKENPSPLVTVSELKQKRTGGLDKKRALVSKDKGKIERRGVKSSVLGKKA